jgi:hypothetical protein
VLLVAFAGCKPARAALVLTAHVDLKSPSRSSPFDPPKHLNDAPMVPFKPTIIAVNRVVLASNSQPLPSNPHRARGHRHTFPNRGFLPWRLSAAGRRSSSNRRARPASETLHKNRQTVTDALTLDTVVTLQRHDQSKSPKNHQLCRSNSHTYPLSAYLPLESGLHRRQGGVARTITVCRQ